MAAHHCYCPSCRCTHKMESSPLPAGVVSTLGLSLVSSRPQLGLALVLGSLIFHRELDQFFRYRCPQCGVALQVLAEIATA